MEMPKEEMSRNGGKKNEKGWQVSFRVKKNPRCLELFQSRRGGLAEKKNGQQPREEVVDHRHLTGKKGVDGASTPFFLLKRMESGSTLCFTVKDLQ